jgi:crossover junction endodeoxyribonuclease RuvC
MATVFVGIDPGITGGMAAVDVHGELIELTMLPVWNRELDSTKLYKMISALGVSRIYAVVERAQAMPGQGVVSMFNYGKTYGAILAVVDLLIGDYSEVGPRTWQKEMFAPGTDDGPKTKSATAATQLWPDWDFRKSKRCSVIHSGLTDAALIAEFARRQYFGGNK